MKLTSICLFIQAIFLYRRVDCGIEQVSSILGQASNLVNAGGAQNAGGLVGGLLNAGGFTNAAGLVNAAGGFSNVGNLMSGDGLLNMMQNSYFTPAPVKAAIVGGKAVAKGIQVYNESGGNITKAATAAANSGLENAVNVVNGVPGAKLGLGVINDWKNGESLSTILVNSGKEAIGFVPMGEQVKDLAMTGVAAAQAYKEGKNVTEVVQEGVKGTLKNYANKHPIAAQINKYVDMAEKGAALIPKDEPGATPKSWLEKGIEIAQNSPLAPAPLKGALAAGKAVAKGVQTYQETKDFKKAGLAAGQAGLGEAVKVANNVPGAQIGMNLLNDLSKGESVQTIIMNGGKEAINFLPADGPAKDLAMRGLGAAQAVKDGKSLTDVVSEGVKGTLMDYASKHPMANKVKEYAEIGQKVANFLPKNGPEGSPASFLEQASSLVNGGIEMVKDNPELNGAVLAGKALAKGIEAYQETGDMRQAAKATTNAGLESAAKVVNNVPGAKLGMNLLNDLKNGESLQTAILNGGKEAIDFIPVNGPVKDLVMNGIAASEALKEKKTVKDIVTEGVEGTILNYASNHPLTEEVQKYVEKGEELAACLPQTEQQNVNQNIPVDSENNHRRGKSRDAEKSHIRQAKRRGLRIAWSKTDDDYYKR